MRLRMLASALIALFLSIVGARNEAVAASAGPFVKGLADQVLAIFSDPRLSFPQREQRMYEIAVRDFDVPYSARFTLGVHWREATDSERAEYEKVFERYIVHFYAMQFEYYHDVDFTVVSERAESTVDTVVTTRITRHDGRPPVTVAWRVTTASGAPKIRDVTIEGVSQLISLRDQFSAVILREQTGVAGLSQRLREKSTQ